MTRRPAPRPDSPGPRSTFAFAGSALLSLVVLFLPEAPDGGLDLPGLDKVVHLGLFALLAATGHWRFGRQIRVLVLVLTYAVVSELIQHSLLADRAGDVGDVLADVVGALSGWALADGVRRIASGSVVSTSSDASPAEDDPTEDDPAEDWATR